MIEVLYDHISCRYFTFKFKTPSSRGLGGFERKEGLSGNNEGFWELRALGEIVLEEDFEEFEQILEIKFML